MNVSHKCPNGILATWDANLEDIDVTCPVCKMSFVYTTEGWQALDGRPAEDGER